MPPISHSIFVRSIFLTIDGENSIDMTTSVWNDIGFSALFKYGISNSPVNAAEGIRSPNRKRFSLSCFLKSSASRLRLLLFSKAILTASSAVSVIFLKPSANATEARKKGARMKSVFLIFIRRVYDKKMEWALKGKIIFSIFIQCVVLY